MPFRTVADRTDFRSGGEETYLSPRAPRTEGVSAAGEEALAVAEEHLDVITTILDALALILTGVDLVLGRGPRSVLQVRERRQCQPVQIVPERTRFICIFIGVLSTCH